jgi:hypothetical protein
LAAFAGEASCLMIADQSEFFASSFAKICSKHEIIYGLPRDLERRK